MAIKDAERIALGQRIASLSSEIAGLKKTIGEQNIKIRSLEGERIKMYTLLSEALRLRRMMEIMSEEIKKLEEDKEFQTKRAEKAERGIRNLKRWMEIKGVKGGYLDVDSIG